MEDRNLRVYIFLRALILIFHGCSRSSSCHAHPAGRCLVAGWPTIVPSTVMMSERIRAYTVGLVAIAMKKWLFPRPIPFELCALTRIVFLVVTLFALCSAERDFPSLQGIEPLVKLMRHWNMVHSSSAVIDAGRVYGMTGILVNDSQILRAEVWCARQGSWER